MDRPEFGEQVAVVVTGLQMSFVQFGGERGNSLYGQYLQLDPES